MRKNKTMRFASMLLVLTLLSTSVISGTFAKYVTSDSATDTARVAKWGVTVEAIGTTFATSHTEDGAAVATVSSSEKVVAPGTDGALAAVKLGGTPEVSTEVTYVATVDLGDNWVDASGNYYCPIVVKLNGVAVTAGSTAAEYEANIKDAIDAKSNGYAAGYDLSTATDDIKLTWEWPYSTTAENDVKDTYLGDQAALATDPKPATISIEIATTVTQVD